MVEVVEEPIAAGLVAVEALASVEAWSAFEAAHGERSIEVAAGLLEGLLAAIPEDGAHGRAYRARLGELIAHVRDRAPWSIVPPDVAEAAGECRVPVGLAGFGNPPAGSPTSRPDGVRSRGVRVVEMLQAAVEDLVAAESARLAFVIEREGQLLVAAGDTDALGVVPLFSLGVDVAALRRAPTRLSAGDTHGVVALVADRLLLSVVCDGPALDTVALSVQRAAEAMAEVADFFPPITDDDLHNLFDP